MYTLLKLSVLAGLILLLVGYFSAAGTSVPTKTVHVMDRPLASTPISGAHISSAAVDSPQHGADSSALNTNTPSTALAPQFIELLKLHNGARTQPARFKVLACRRSVALPSAVRWNNKLARAAQKQADWMAINDTLSHGTSLGQRVKAQHYFFRAIAENIADAHLPADRLFQLWLSSERHCKNILNPVYQDIGIGNNGQYWSVVLGKAL